MCVANVLGSKATNPTWEFDSDGNLNGVEDRGSSLLLSEWLDKTLGMLEVKEGQCLQYLLGPDH